jgi:hypothetical protein
MWTSFYFYLFWVRKRETENRIIMENITCENTKRLKNHMFEGLYKDVNRNVAFKELNSDLFQRNPPLSNKIICKP